MTDKVDEDEGLMMMMKKLELDEWGFLPYFYIYFNYHESPDWRSPLNHNYDFLRRSLRDFVHECDQYESFDFSIGTETVGGVKLCSYAELQEITDNFNSDRCIQKTLCGRLFRGTIGEGSEKQSVIVKTWDFLRPYGHGHVQRPFDFCDQIKLFTNKEVNTHPRLAKLCAICCEIRLAVVYDVKFDENTTRFLSDVLLKEILQKEQRFVYAVDVNAHKLLNLEPHTWEFISELKPKVGLIEHLSHDRTFGDIMSTVHACRKSGQDATTSDFGDRNLYNGSHTNASYRKSKVAVVGSGTAGLFASLVLAEFGVDVTLMERGEAVDKMGRDIGALVVRRILQEESNFFFGEDFTGSSCSNSLCRGHILKFSTFTFYLDGCQIVNGILIKSVVLYLHFILVFAFDLGFQVLETLVRFGAPPKILVDGKTHLGTDKLIPLLQDFGVTLKSWVFGTRVDDLLVKDKHVVGVKVSDSRENRSPSTSQQLGIQLRNQNSVDCLVAHAGVAVLPLHVLCVSFPFVLSLMSLVGLRVEHPQELINSIQYSGLANEVQSGRGKVPVADYKVVEYVNTDGIALPSNSAPRNRSCYSFCMCPGGQVVLTSTNPSELCVSGMSFSRQSSKWANAALVVTVSSKDFAALDLHIPLGGVEFQRMFERRAAAMGEGNFVVPDCRQEVYYLNNKEATLLQLLVSSSLQTRTSSPVQISRSADPCECTSLRGLYPIGEGAGYAGGIVSAAVGGMYSGFALAKCLGLFHGSIELILGKAQSAGVAKY
ncbi:hypothetical protein P3L10_020121 [Capsicum annuum]